MDKNDINVPDDTIDTGKVVPKSDIPPHLFHSPEYREKFDRAKKDPKLWAELAQVKGGQVARSKANIRKMANMVLRYGVNVSPEQITKLVETSGEKITVEEAIMLSMANKAILGDVKCAEFIRDTAGFKPATSVEVTHLDPDERISQKIIEMMEFDYIEDVEYTVVDEESDNA